MSSPADLKANAVNVTKTFKKLSANAFAISSGLSAMGGPGPLPSNVDYGVAQNGWSTPVNAAVADFQALAKQCNDFVTAMGTALSATYESARFDPLWNLMRDISTTPLTYEAAFAGFFATTTAFAVSYDSAAATAGTTDFMQPLLDAYPGLTTSAADSVSFLKSYKTALGEDVSAVLLWAGRDLSGRDIAMPQVLKDFKAIGNSDYTINATILTQLASTDFSTHSSS